MKKSIWVHTLVKNEERYVWYAVMSVIDHVDKVLLWDTGSTDKTVEVINEIKKIKGEKIDFKEIGSVDPEQFTKVRQQMLEQTKSNWFLIVDGDEVWWNNSIKKIVDTIQKEGDNLEMIVSPYYNIIGDIYHYQEEEAGRYQIDGRHGHINIRAINRNIEGLHFEKPHGQQGLYDQNGILIQERNKKQRKFIDAPYMHFTNMIRSYSRQSDLKVPKRKIKYKHEIGLSFSNDFNYPEIFYQERPTIVPSPWDKMSKSYYVRGLGETFLRKVKRRLIPFKNSGY